jgi:hypothetical protein
MPNDEDYFGVMKAIHRLAQTYLLEPKDLRFGNISQKYSAIRPVDCNLYELLS